MGIEDLNYRLRSVRENELHQPRVIDKPVNRKSAAKKKWWENKKKAEADAAELKQLARDVGLEG